MKKQVIILISLVILFTLSCTNPETEFSKAKEQNSITALHEFLDKYPESEFTEAANELLVDLEWEKTVKENTSDAYDQFIARYPISKYNEEARNNMLELECSWDDGFLVKKYIADGETMSLAFSTMFNSDNSMLIGFNSSEKGTVTTYLGSQPESARITEDESGSNLKVSVIKQVLEDGSATIGFKVNDGDKAAPFYFHRILTSALENH